MEITQVEETGFFEVRFSKDILWPDNILEWTSSNEGASFFAFEFSASDETLEFLENEEFEINISWKVVQVSSRVVKMHMDFSHEEIVSKYFRKGQIDYIELKLLATWEEDLNVKIVNHEERHNARVLPQVDKEQINLSLETV